MEMTMAGVQVQQQVTANSAIGGTGRRWQQLLVMVVDVCSKLRWVSALLEQGLL
jgi:hypothetical protein